MNPYIYAYKATISQINELLRKYDGAGLDKLLSELGRQGGTLGRLIDCCTFRDHLLNPAVFNALSKKGLMATGCFSHMNDGNECLIRSTSVISNQELDPRNRAAYWIRICSRGCRLDAEQHYFNLLIRQRDMSAEDFLRTYVQQCNELIIPPNCRMFMLNPSYRRLIAFMRTMCQKSNWTDGCTPSAPDDDSAEPMSTISRWSDFVTQVDDNNFLFRGFHRKFLPVDAALMQALGKDNYPLLRMKMALRNTGLGITIVKVAIKNKACDCLRHFFLEHRKRMLKLKSIEEWLFFACRVKQGEYNEVALCIIDALEKISPGVVARARDPWGFDALWNTINEHGIPRSRANRLIELGCDPDRTDENGISFGMVMEMLPAQDE